MYVCMYVCMYVEVHASERLSPWCLASWDLVEEEAAEALAHALSFQVLLHQSSSDLPVSLTFQTKKMSFHDAR